MFGDIIHKIRHGLDDVGAFFTGQPAQNAPHIGPQQPSLPQFHTQQQGQIRLPQPQMRQPLLGEQQSTLPKLPSLDKNGQFQNPNQFANKLATGQFTAPKPTFQAPSTATQVFHDPNGNVTGYSTKLQDVQTAPYKPPTMHDTFAHDVTHNPVTNMVGGAVKFIPQFAENYANTFANLGNKLAGGQDLPIQQNLNDPFSHALQKMSGATGTNRQLTADAAQIGVSAVTPLIGKAVAPLATGAVGTIAPGSSQEAVNLARLGLHQAPTAIDNALRYGTNALEAGTVNSLFQGSQTAGQQHATPVQAAQSAAAGFVPGAAFGVGGTALGDVAKVVVPQILHHASVIGQTISQHYPRTVWRGAPTDEAPNFVTGNKGLAQEFANDTNGTLQKYAIQPKDVLDLSNPEQRAQVAQMLGPEASQILDKTPSGNFSPEDENLARGIANILGYKGVKFDERSNGLPTPDVLKNNPYSIGITDHSALTHLPQLSNARQAVANLLKIPEVQAHFDPNHPQDSLAALKQEALKYKSADEFVNSQSIHHGTTAPIDKLSIEHANTFEPTLNRGIYTTADKSVADTYANRNGVTGKVFSYKKPESGKVFDYHSDASLQKAGIKLPDVYKSKSAYNTYMNKVMDSKGINYAENLQAARENAIFDRLAVRALKNMGDANPARTWEEIKNTPVSQMASNLDDTATKVLDQINTDLRNQGFDFAKHIGGTRTGNKLHDVYIALHDNALQPQDKQRLTDLYNQAHAEKGAIALNDTPQSYETRTGISGSPQEVIRQIAYPANSIGEKLGMFRGKDFKKMPFDQFKQLYFSDKDIQTAKQYGLELPSAEDVYNGKLNSGVAHAEATNNLPSPNLLITSESKVFDNNPLNVPEAEQPNLPPENPSQPRETAPINVTVPKARVEADPELQSLYQAAEQSRWQTPLDQIKAEDALRRAINQRNATAEQAALNHLANGGTRDEAIKVYQENAPGVSQKMAAFRVSRAAKQAEQSLNVKKATENPLLNQFKLEKPGVGQYDRITANHRAVQNSIRLVEEKALSFEKQLSKADRANLIDYIEGTKPINQSDEPMRVQLAVNAWQQAADTVHALGENFGHTKHIPDFFPGYWDREDPATLEKEQLQAEQDVEEQLGPDVWRNMSPDEKAQAVADYQAGPGVLSEDANYGGFHAKSKTFKTQSEGIEAGYKPLYDNPFDAMRRYFGGAKMQLGNQAVIQGIREAEPIPGQGRRTVDLPGDASVKVAKPGYKMIKTQAGLHEPKSRLIKGYKGATRAIVKTIVANPLIHGQNQEFNALFSGAWHMPGWKVANMARIIHDQAKLATDSAERDRLKTDFYKDGGFSPDYGKTQYGFIAKGLDKTGLDPKHAEILPRTMASIEENIRLALYKTARKQGMDSKTAISEIDKALGSPDVINDMASAFGLFTHYLMTNVKILGRTGKDAAHGNVKPLLGLAAGYAAYWAANKAWQNATGNPNASVRAPGVIGTARQLAEAPGQIAKGQLPTVISSHTNPLITTGFEELANKNLREPVVGPASNFNSLTGPHGSGRGNVAITNLFGPTTTIKSVAGNKQSVGEAGLGYLTGLYTPHAKGYKAVPDQNSPVAFLNQPGAKVEPSGDPTGYQQMKQYFNALDNIDNGLSENDKNLANNFIMHDKTEAGQTIEPNQQQTASRWSDLASNPHALAAVQKFYQQSGSHNPEWDLNPEQLRTWANYKTLAPGDLQKSAIAQRNPWISDLENKIGQWYNSLQLNGNVVHAPGYIPYPTIAPDVQNLMTQSQQLAAIPAGQRTAAQEAQLKAIEDNPKLQDAYNQLDTYNNQVRAQWGMPQIQYSPKESPEVSAFTSQYMGGDKASRSALRTKYPALYAQMQQALEQQSLSSAEKYGGEAYYGSQVPDSFLSSLYSLGNYDISKIPNANGSNTYALNNFTGTGSNPNGLPMAVSSGSGFSSGHGYGNSAQRKLIRSLKFGSRLRDVYVPRHYRVTHPQVHTRHINSGKGLQIVPRGHYTAVKVTKHHSNKVKNIKVSGVKQYKPAD